MTRAMSGATQLALARHRTAQWARLRWLHDQAKAAAAAQHIPAADRAAFDHAAALITAEADRFISTAGGPPRTSDGTEIIAGLCLQHGSTLYQVREVTRRVIAAKVLIEHGVIPARTVVRRLSSVMAAEMTTAMPEQLNSYQAALAATA